MWYTISDYGGTIIIRYLINIFDRLRIAVSKVHSTIETKEAVCIGHSAVLIQPDYSGEGEVHKKKFAMSNAGSFFVSIVMYPTCTIILLSQEHIPTTTLKWVYWSTYGQASVPFIKYQILEITEYTSLHFFLVNLYRKI